MVIIGSVWKFRRYKHPNAYHGMSNCMTIYIFCWKLDSENGGNAYFFLYNPINENFTYERYFITFDYFI